LSIPSSMQGRLQEAAQLYSRAVQGNPTSIPLLKTAVEARLQKKRFADAENMANRLLALQPRDPEALELLGDAQAAEGKLPDARNSYDSALANSPSDRVRKTYAQNSRKSAVCNREPDKAGLLRRGSWGRQPSGKRSLPIVGTTLSTYSPEWPARSAGRCRNQSRW
jgi:tetratricopeptide (TPR) repeat protein